MFRDEKLNRKIWEARQKFKEHLEKIWREKLAPYRERHGVLKEKVQTILERYQDELHGLKCRMGDELYDYSLELEALRQDVENAISEIDVEVPELPEPKTPPEPEPDGWLFDSVRNYEKQLAVYKKRKNGNVAADEEEKD